MEKKNNKLTILLCLIIVLLAILCGYFGVTVFNQKECDTKCTNDDNNIEVDNNLNENNDNQEAAGFVKPEEHIEIDANIKKELVKVFETVYNYMDDAYYGDYCFGESNINDEIDFLSEDYKDYEDYYRGNYASIKYNSFKEMMDYLKKYMTESVIFGIYDMSSDLYVEKNGKLYCPHFMTGKGSVYDFGSAKIKYSKPGYNNGYKVTMETTLVNGYDEDYHEVFDVMFEKKNDNWVITYYKQVQY